MSAETEKSFEGSLEELEQIVRQLEAGDLPLARLNYSSRAFGSRASVRSAWMKQSVKLKSCCVATTARTNPHPLKNPTTNECNRKLPYLSHETCCRGQSMAGPACAL